MQAEAVLWVVGLVAAVLIVAFAVFLVRFVAKAAVSYVKHRPYPSLAVFTVSGGLASFITTFVGGGIRLAVVIGAGVGIAVLLLVATELGAD